jgi:integrase
VGYVTAKAGANGKTRYTAMYRDITGKPRSAGTYDTEDTALRKANDAERDAKQGRGGDEKKSRTRLNAYFTDEWRVNHVMEQTTEEGYVYLFNRYLAPEFGDMRIRDITPDRVRKWVTRLSTHYGANPPTIRNVKVLFDAIMTTLLTDRVIHHHPGRGIKTPPIPRKPRRIVSAAQYRTFCDGVEDPRMRMLVEFDVETGLRWGELTELRPKDIDLTTGIVTVARVVIQLKSATADGQPRFVVKEYPKDKEWRQVKLASHLRDELAEYIRDHHLGPNDLLFPLPEVTGPARRRRPAVLPDPLTLGFTDPNDKGRTYRHGTLTAYQAGKCRCQHCKDAVAAYRANRRALGKDDPRTPRTTTTDTDRHMSNDWFRHNVWNPAADKAALGFRITPHSLRHSHASWLLAGGADLQVVKERLGHGSITTTEKYLHTLPGHHDVALAALDNIRPARTSRAPSPQPPPSPAADNMAMQEQQAQPQPPAPTVTAGGTATDPHALLAALGPDVVRQVLTGLLQQVQPPTGTTP